MRNYGIFLLCLAAAGCGASTPTAPPAPQAVRHLLEVTGFAFSSDPQFPPCSPLGVPRDGTAISTFVDMAREGSEWVGRSSSSDLGSLELRYRQTGTVLGRAQVSGTIRGTGIHTPVPVFSSPRDVRALFGFADGPAAEIQGEALSPTSTFIGGRISGLIRFTDSSFSATSTCSAVQWSIQLAR